MGLWKTQRDVMCLVEMHVKNKGLLKSNTISNGWWESSGHDGKCTQYINTKTHAHLHTHSKNYYNVKFYTLF